VNEILIIVPSSCHVCVTFNRLPKHIHAGFMAYYLLTCTCSAMEYSIGLKVMQTRQTRSNKREIATVKSIL